MLNLTSIKGYEAHNIREFLEKPDEAKCVRELIAEFRCPNAEVENFLHEQAIDFTKKNQSVTYLVFTEGDNRFVAYFTLAVKPIAVDISRFSKTVQRQILRVAQERDPITGKHRLSAYLLAQIGKNYADGANERITGAQLLSIAVDLLRRAQHFVGGRVVFLESDIDKRLLAFYESSGFKRFDARMSDDDGILVQMLRVI